jgi:hypothetical protein
LDLETYLSFIGKKYTRIWFIYSSFNFPLFWVNQSSYFQ